VTRKSVIELARLRGYTVEEAPVTVEEAMKSDEVFTTGTAVVLCAVGSLTYKVRLIVKFILASPEQPKNLKFCNPFQKLLPG
jgi:branched-subunit amino acid aminotransferase/4-amino-4-deoxychorismate lyase